jgi:hypothetical protein
VHALAEAGVLVVVGDRKVRGTVERTYRLNRSLVSMDSETAATMSRDDHRRAFTAATAALLADFEAYISQSHADPLRDSVSYRQIPVWLSDEERLELVNGFQALIDDAMRQEPSKDRRGYLLSPIFFPMIGDD